MRLTRRRAGPPGEQRALSDGNEHRHVVMSRQIKTLSACSVGDRWQLDLLETFARQVHTSGEAAQDRCALSSPWNGVSAVGA